MEMCPFISLGLVLTLCLAGSSLCTLCEAGTYASGTGEELTRECQVQYAELARCKAKGNTRDRLKHNCGKASRQQ